MSPEQFQTTFDVLPEPTLLLAADGVILAANRAVGDRLGLDRLGLRGRRLGEVVADPAAKVAEYLRACARSRSLVLGALSFARADGSSVACRCEGAVLPASAPGEEGRLLLRLLPKESAARQFVFLSEKIEELSREVRKRQRAEQEVRQRQEWLQVTLESIGDAVITTDAAGQVAFLNPVAEALTGWTSAEAAGLSLDDVFRIINEHSRRPVENPVTRVLQDGAVVGLANHTVLIARDGRERCIDDSAAPIRDGGKISGVVLIFRDITARRQAERAEAHLAAVVASADDFIVSKNLDGVVQSWNRGAERAFGYTAAEMIGQPILRLVPPERPGEEEGILRRLRRGETIEHLETVRVRKDGTRIEVSVTISPVRDSHGTIIGSSKIGRDITDRKRAERAARFLADASAALAGIVDYESTLQKLAALAVPFFADWCTVDMVTTHGALRRGAVAHVDPAKVALGHELHRRYPPDPEAPHGIPHILRTGQAELVPEITDTLLAERVKDPELLAIIRELGLKSSLGVPLKVQGKTLGVLTFIAAESGRRYGPADLQLAVDLAYRAGIAIENARLYQELKEADRRKDDFLATLAHELRNPLAPVRNALQILRMRGIDAASAEKAREMMDRQIQHLVRLVDDLLDVSRIMRDKIELRKEPIELATVIARAVELAHPAIDAQGHELVVSLPPGEPLRLEGDVVRLTQVLANLLTNAAKYTERAGKIWLTAGHEGDMAVLKVRDNGIGIPADLLPHVFDLFVQAERSIARSQGGLGIGLTLVRRLVGLHGGEVTAHSEGPGKGSEFAIRLPLSPPAGSGQALPRSAGPDAPGHQPAPRRRILVVDDNVDAAESLALMVKTWGHDVLTVHDGPKALAAFPSYAPAVVLLDIGLPGLSGYEVAQRLRAREDGRDVLLVAMTGYGQDEDRRRSREAGFDHHLVKPVNPDEVQKLLAKPVQGGTEASRDKPKRNS